MADSGRKEQKTRCTKQQHTDVLWYVLSKLKMHWTDVNSHMLSVRIGFFLQNGRAEEVGGQTKRHLSRHLSAVCISNTPGLRRPPQMIHETSSDVPISAAVLCVCFQRRKRKAPFWSFYIKTSTTSPHWEQAPKRWSQCKRIYIWNTISAQVLYFW